MKISELLKDESCWTKSQFARDVNNVPVEPGSPDACSWCLIGALDKCYASTTTGSEARTKLTDAVRQYSEPQCGSGWGVSTYNDREQTTFADIKAILEIAGV